MRWSIALITRAQAFARPLKSIQLFAKRYHDIIQLADGVILKRHASLEFDDTFFEFMLAHIGYLADTFRMDSEFGTPGQPVSSGQRGVSASHDRPWQDKPG